MKHIELFNNGFDSTVQEKIQPENWPYIGHDIVSGEMVYTLVPEPDTINYFYIESLEDNNIITLDSTTWAGYGDNKSKLEYSNDTTSWTSMNGVDSITINKGEYLYMRCIEGNICKNLNDVSEEETQNVMLTPLFKTSTNCNIGGNINTVMFDYTYKTEDCVLLSGPFVGLFIGMDIQTGEIANYIVDASKLELPATTLSFGCYTAMFGYCTFLVQTPELHATTLADYCYENMFEGCTSLTTTPKLPATKLAEGCYQYMFTGCTSLTTAPKLPATKLANYCYEHMFNGCTSLTTAPELPAATLEKSCYYAMFENCANLNYVKCLATDISAELCTVYWIWNVSNNGTFVKHPDMNDWITNYAGIPEGWTVVDAEL